MIGEFDYADIFYSETDDVRDHHPAMTFIMFVVFVFIMTIIIMNLLVSFTWLCDGSKDRGILFWFVCCQLYLSL